MHFGSVYLISDDFDKSIEFYMLLLQENLAGRNSDRFAVFDIDGSGLAIMNAHFDSKNPDKVVHRGAFTPYFDDLEEIAALPNTRKAVLNLWTENLSEEHKRLKALNISDSLTEIKYVCYSSPYYYFQLDDPDGNIIEVTGGYSADCT